MATDHFERQGTSSPARHKQQFFVVCGPPVSTRKALPSFLRKHWLVTSLVMLLGVFLAGAGGAMLGAPGVTIMWGWRCELLALALSVGTLCCYRTFRRWGQERKRHEAARRTRKPDLSALLSTPPPLHPLVQVRPEFAITIEHWKSNEPECLPDEHLPPAALPDELLAPDALVFQVEVKKAA